MEGVEALKTSAACTRVQMGGVANWSSKDLKKRQKKLEDRGSKGLSEIFQLTLL